MATGKITRKDFLRAAAAGALAMPAIARPGRAFAQATVTLKLGHFVGVGTTEAAFSGLNAGKNFMAELASTGALDVANNDIFYFDAELHIRTAGGSGTLVGCGLVSIGTPGTATMKSFALASTAIDTTAAQQIGISATWSAANAGDSCRLDNLSIERKAA